MNLYLAGDYALKSQLRRLAGLLADRGHNIVSTWLEEPDAADGIKARLDANALTPEDRDDLEDINARNRRDVMRADCMVLFNGPGTSGGKFVEFGAAWIKRLPVVWIGPETNFGPFDSNQVKVFPDLRPRQDSDAWLGPAIQAALEAIDEIEIGG
jgi:hypothetical protein